MSKNPFDLWAQKAFYGLISFCAVFLVNQIREMSASVQELNIRIAVVVQQVSEQQNFNKDVEGRLRAMEVKRGER